MDLLGCWAWPQSTLTSHTRASRDQTQNIILQGKHFYPLSHLTGSTPFLYCFPPPPLHPLLSLSSSFFGMGSWVTQVGVELSM